MPPLLKGLVTLTESPTPKVILVSGDFGTSSHVLVQQMVNNLLTQTPSCLYHIKASPFSRSNFSWSNNTDIQHFASTFQNYGEDECVVDAALAHINTAPGEDIGTANLTHLDNGTEDSQQKEQQNDCSTVPGNKRTVILLEGLEAALLRTSVRCLLASIRRAVQGRGVALLLCGSTDALPSATVTALRHAASASLHLENTDQSASQNWQGIARVQLQRPGGKLLHTCEYYKLSATSVVASPCNVDLLRSLSIYEAMPSPPPDNDACCGATPASCSVSRGKGMQKTAPPVDDKDVDKILSSQTTFNLKLSDQERQDKNSLELPHHRARGGGGGGRVLYTPDREDWDEDDPDDDLDI